MRQTLRRLVVAILVALTLSVPLVHAASSTNYTVGSGATVLIATGVRAVTIYNGGPYQIYIGGSGVTAEDGFVIPSGWYFTPAGSLATLETLYALAAGNSSDVRVLTLNGL